jgi:biotin carboxylase
MDIIVGLLPPVEAALARYGIEHRTLVEPRKRDYARSLGRPETILSCANPADTEVVLATVERAGLDPAAIRLVWGTGEFTIVSAALAAGVLGRPGRLAPAAALAFRDKWLQKQRIAAAGLAAPRRHLVESPDDVPEAARRVGFPAVVKPVAGAATTLTFRVEDPGQLATAAGRILAAGTADRITRYGAALVEEYVTGEEYHLDGCVFDGEIPTLGLSWYLDNNLEVLRRGDPCSAVLLDPGQEPGLYREAAELARGAVRALGLRTGFFHMEAFRTPAGFQFSECAARPGGNGVWESFRYKFGIDLFDEHVRSVAGLPPTPARVAPGVFCRTFVGAPPGIVTAMPGLDDLLARPGVLEGTVDVAVGQPVPDMHADTNARPASAIVHAGTVPRLLDRLSDLKAWYYASVTVRPEPAPAPEPPPKPPPGPDQTVLDMLRGHAITQLVASAARLGLWEILDTGVRDPAAIGRAAGLDERVAPRYLAALQALGLVAPDGRGGLTATDALALLDRKSGSLYGQALMSGDQYYQAWAALDHALATGTSAFRHALGHGLWEELSLHPEVAAQFTRTMGQNMSRVAADIIRRYPFPDRGTLVDLGAGDGTLALEILRARPGLRAVLVEQASIVPVLRDRVAKADATGRCATLAGNVLAGVPSGADLYLLKSVLHNWGDDQAVAILGRCRAAMGAAGRLLIVERVPRPGADAEAAIRDLVMLVLFGSADRTLDEWGGLLRRAGLRVTTADADADGLALIEARP